MKKNLFRFFIISIILIVSLLFAIPSYVFGVDDDKHQTTDTQHSSTYIQNHSSHHDDTIWKIHSTTKDAFGNETSSQSIQNHSTHHDESNKVGNFNSSFTMTHDNWQKQIKA